MQVRFDLMGVETVETDDGGMSVPLGQEAEPIVPLMVDARARRDSVQATPVYGTPLAPACTVPAEASTSGENDQGAGGTPAAGILVGTLIALATGRALRRQMI